MIRALASIFAIFVVLVIGSWFGVNPDFGEIVVIVLCVHASHIAAGVVDEFKRTKNQL